jgi:hypothetical protein
MKKLLILTLLSIGLLAQAATVNMLSPLTTFGPVGDGSIQPPALYPPYPPVTIGTANTGFQRGYAYDPTTGMTVLVDPNVGNAGNNPNFQGGIYVIDGTSGNVVSTLAPDGIYGPADGGWPASGLGVADDGVVYICNQVSGNASQVFTIYSWANVWQSNTGPSIAFSSTIPVDQRYGATMAVRGAGTNTQIIIGSKSKSGTSGTNVVLFTTADGVNFNAIPMATDVTKAELGDGIAFGAGNTFWVKGINGGPLRLMSFDPVTANATTLAKFDAAVMAASANLGPLAIDLTNKLLAAIESITSGGIGQRVWLYDISATLTNTAAPPMLLDIKTYPSNNTGANAPSGFLAFGGGNLYSHVINNGLLSFAVGSVSMPAPIISSQPTPSTTSILSGQSAQWDVLGYPAVSAYQWRQNGTNVANATNTTLSIVNATTASSGTYTVVLSNSAGSTTSAPVVLTVVNSAPWHLKPLWAVGPTAGADYLNNLGGQNTPEQRTIAFNTRSNELYIPARLTPTGTAFQIYAIPATNVSFTPPAILKQLNLTGVSGGNIALVGIACADDGSIYACNETATGNWELYRWADSDPATQPVLVYGPAAPDQQATTRYGDNLTVRGSGIDTQIIIDNNSTSARFVVVLTPTDSSLTQFTATYNTVATTFANSTIGRSLQWVSSSNLSDFTFWQKHYGTTLIQSTFVNSSGSVASSNISYTSFPSTMGPVWVDAPHNILVGIKTNNATTPHTLELYDVTALTNPVSIASYPFPNTLPQGNVNFIAQTLVSGNYVFAISGNNGVMGFQLLAGPPTKPIILSQPQNLDLLLGASGTLSVVADQLANIQWLRNGTNLSGATSVSYAITNAQLTNAGSYICVLSNSAGMTTSAVATVTVSPHTLGIVRNQGGVTISYNTVLQSSTNVAGPYADVPGATNPYSFTIPPGARQMFWRSRLP